MAQAGTDILPLLHAVKTAADRSRRFGPTQIRESGAGNHALLVCRARNSAAPASYRLELDSGKIWVSLVMADRWLSESIESHLVEHGDKLEDLLDEELAELDYHPSSPAPLTFEHFRSEDCLFTFRTPLPLNPAQANSPAAIDTATKLLLGYEACFRQLGDMDAGEEASSED